MIDVQKHMQELRERSGDFETNDPLVAFLYELMRDHMVPGKIEGLIMNTPAHMTYKLTNGWLAGYADDLAKRLRKEGK